MEFLRKYLSGKRYGYFVTVAVAILLLVTAITYTALFVAFKRDYDLSNSIILFVGFGVSALLILINKTKYAHYVEGILSLAALVVFINGIYLFASEVMTGIDYNQAEYTPFMICAILHVITYLVAMVNCFLPQVKAQNLEEEVEANE